MSLYQNYYQNDQQLDDETAYKSPPSVEYTNLNIGPNAVPYHPPASIIPARRQSQYSLRDPVISPVTSQPSYYPAQQPLSTTSSEPHYAPVQPMTRTPVHRPAIHHEEPYNEYQGERSRRKYDDGTNPIISCLCCIPKAICCFSSTFCTCCCCIFLVFIILIVVVITQIPILKNAVFSRL